MNAGYDNQDAPDPNDEEEGVARAQDLETKLLRIAEIAVECEFEALGPQPLEKYYELIAECAFGKYKSQTAISFLPSIETAMNTVFGDLPQPYYDMYIAQISQEVYNFFTDMYIYFLKVAFLHAIEELLELHKENGINPQSPKQP